jgi:hypothetical protein
MSKNESTSGAPVGISKTFGEVANDIRGAGVGWNLAIKRFLEEKKEQEKSG